MDLTRLKWTKNINREDGEWAYSYKDIDDNSKIFNLHWKSDSYENAQKPQEKDLIILRQKGKVTHIVELLNNYTAVCMTKWDSSNNGQTSYENALG